MREATFLQHNADKWRRLEGLADDRKADPDELASLFVEASDDLSYARTFYPKSKSVAYLNDLLGRLYRTLYKNKTTESHRFRTFWTHEVPLAVWSARWLMGVAFIVALVCTAVGVASQVLDPDFVRYVMGDYYVDMTLANIESGDPMAVYRRGAAVDSFAAITFNNVRVSLLVYSVGVLTPLIPLFILMRNMLMLGCFFAFLAQQGVFGTALGIVWVHGTLEIAAIVIAGGAGFQLGWGWIAPGTMPRLTAFAKSARSSVTIIVGLLPVFLVAGLLEGFVTRHTMMPLVVKLLIIGASLAFLIGYFFVLPLVRARAAGKTRLTPSASSAPRDRSGALALLSTD